MPSSWKIKDGDFYVADSSIANDANAGGENDPKASPIGFATNRKVVYGAGVYRGGFSQGYNASDNTQWVADGLVIFDGDGSNSFTASPFNVDSTSGYYGIIFRNYATFKPKASGVHSLYACRVENCFNLNSVVAKDGTIIFNCQADPTKYYDPINNGPFYNNRSIVYNSVLGRGTILDTYISKTSILYWEAISHDRVQGTKNNYNGILRINTTGTNGTNEHDYAVQDSLTGTPQDNGYPVGVQWLSSANLQADGMDSTNADAWEALLGTKLINVDPKFNNAEKGDFTLKLDSPHIAAATNLTNIGGTKVALGFYVPESASFSGNNLTLNSSYTLLNPNLTLTRQDTNTIVGTGDDNLIGDILVANNSFKLDWMNYDGNFVKKAGKVYPIDTFTIDASFSPPSGENDNALRVDDIDPDGTAIETPARLTFLFTWTDSISKPVTDAGNNYMVDNRATASTWLKMEFGLEPSVDKNCKGNGDPAFQGTDDSGKYPDEVGFDPTTGPRIVEFTWCRCHIFQRRDYHVPS